MTGTTVQHMSFKLSIVPTISRGISTPLKKGFGWVEVFGLLLCFKMQKDKAFQDDILRITAESVRRNKCHHLAHHTRKNINDVVK